MIVDDKPVSAGIFQVNANGELSNNSFTVSARDLQNASAYVLTIEPHPDNDPAPSAVHILAGDFSGDLATATVSHKAAIGHDFKASSGQYILATPTDGGSTTDENSGVWFLNPSNGMASLNLPELPEGWAYEGWAVIEGQPLSTGVFTSPSSPDDDATYSGTAGAPPYPGEDFLHNAPAGLTFPTDLSEQSIVISVEPVPDNSEAPFLLKPLVGQVPAMADDHTLYNLNNNAASTNPRGMIRR